MTMKRRFALAGTGVFMLSLALLAGIHGAEKNDESSAQMKILEQGNQRFVSGELSTKDLPAQRGELVKGQHPYAVILTCSDSRVPPELLFDESLGKLFVIRVAGNVVDPIVLGSVEYAVEHLGSSLVLVLGHSGCGAVKATIAGGEFPPNIRCIAEAIAPAVTRARVTRLDGKQLEDEAITDNVEEQLAQLRKKSPIVKEREHKGELQVRGGVYDLETGKIHFFH